MKLPWKRDRRPVKRRRPGVVMERAWRPGLPGAGLGAKDHAPNRPVDHDVYDAIRKLRPTARQEVQNGSAAASYVHAAQRNIIGHAGLKPRSNDSERERIEELWADWSASCGVDGESFWELERGIVLSLITDGEAFFRYSRDADGRLRILVMDPGRLDEEYNKKVPGGEVVMGVEKRDGVTVAYHFRIGSTPKFPAGSDYTRTGKRQRIPADEVLAVMWRQFPLQTRGIPILAPVLVAIEQLRHYETSEMVASRMATRRAGYITTPEGEAVFGDAPDDVEDSGDRLEEGERDPVEDSRELWWRQQYAGGGGVNYGADLTELDPGQGYIPDQFDHPKAGYEPFSKSQQRSIAAGLGLSYHALSGDLSGINFSAGRIGELASRQTWASLRRLITMRFHQPLFRKFVEEMSLRGELRGLPSDLAKVTWAGEQPPSIQPREQARAEEVALLNKTKSLSEVIMDSGREPAAVFAQIAEDIAALEALGLTYPGMSGNVASEPVEEEPVQEDAEEAPQDAQEDDLTDDGEEG